MPRSKSLTDYTRRRLESPLPGEDHVSPSSEEEALHKVSVEGRLLGCLDDWRCFKLSDFEFLPLMGQLVRWCGVHAESPPVALYLPPGRTPDWSMYGLKVTGRKSGAAILECALHEIAGVGEELRSAIVRACRQEALQTPNPELGDPWISLTSHGQLGEEARLPMYMSDGQRRLIRALDGLRPGQVLIGCLPTGEGKSLAIHRLVLESTRLVVVVVPTVTLAIDQEQEAEAVLARHGLPQELAYLGGDSGRGRIKSRIKDGTQRLVFANPESLRGLMPALMEAAREGNLGAVVVDEAHVIDADSWDFRPDFGLIPSMVRGLTEQVPDSAVPPKSLLLSATLTQATIDNLKRLFVGKGRGVLLAGSLRLRPEPAYVRERVDASPGEGAGDDASIRRRQRILDLIPLLPRPLYLYSTTQADVEYYHGELHRSGLRRIRHVHGGVGSGDRREAIRGVREQRLDVVSANSAFGLGLNVPNVRSVVHACVPESLDRFSQEVGRGGRDGMATISLMVFTPSDRVLARKQGARKILKDAGGPRWQDMKAGAIQSGGNILWLPLDAHEKKSDTSRRWAMSTVVLMEASGLLQVEWGQTPPDDADWLDLCVRILDATVDRDNWTEKTDGVRQAVNRADEGALGLFRKVLDGEVPIEEALRSTYAIEAAPGDEIRPPAIRPRFSDRIPVMIGATVAPPCQNPGRGKVLLVEEAVGVAVAKMAKFLLKAGYCDWLVDSPLENDLLLQGCRGLDDVGARQVRLFYRGDLEGDMPGGRGRRKWLYFWSSDTISSEELDSLWQDLGEGVVVCQSTIESSHPCRPLEQELGSLLVTRDNFEHLICT